VAAERIVTWLCVGILVALAGLLSVEVAASVAEGSIRQFAKYGVGRELVAAREPVAYWAAVVFHLLVCAAFWYFAFWAWSSRLRGGR
jgi:hypothetical protein